MTDDPLNGFRAVEREDDDLAPMEALLKRQMAANQGLIQLVIRSEALDRWMQTDAGKALQQELNSQLDEATQVWLLSDDPTSDAVRKAHFQARVCVGMAQLIAKIIKAGPEARSNVEASDAAANAEMNENG
jgi:hypothetical protein